LHPEMLSHCECFANAKDTVADGPLNRTAPHNEFTSAAFDSHLNLDAMMTDTNWLRLFGAGYFLLCGTMGAPAADESRWDGDARGAVRLIAGTQPTAARMAGAVQTGPASKQGAGDALRAGIEIKLGRGWHTYWRYPGDSGVPPQFDFGQSQNVKSVDVLWPVPQRLAEAGGVAIGYVNNVIFPLRVVPADATKPVVLRLKLDYAICEKLCVPVEGKVELSLARGPSSQDAALSAAEARVPQKQALGQGSALAVRSVRREDGAPRPQVVVDLVAPAGASVDLFAEGPTPQWALPVPEPVKDVPAGVRRFSFEIDGVPPGASDRGVLLTLTAVESGQGIEVEARLD
jgi:DsbC/DsbD-like thiol-disulfide interchange protein